MKFSLPHFALRRPITVVMISVSMLVVGVIAWNRMPLMFLPRIDEPFIGVSIPYPSASPEQVEQQIAIPVEGEFRTIPGLRRIRTISDSNGLFASLRFSLDTDMNSATADVRDRIERLKLKLPAEVDRMLIQRFSSRSIPVMAVGIFNEGDQEEFVNKVRTVFEPRLRRVDGVAMVEVLSPIQEKEVLVEFDQNTLRSMNLGLAQVIAALQQSSLNISVGELAEAQSKYFVRVSGEYRSIDDIRELVVAPNGMRLKDAATVRYAGRSEFAYVALDGKGGAVVLVTKESEANTVSTCRGLRAELDKLLAEPMFEGTQKRVFFDQAELIETALNNLFASGLYGGAMAILVLFSFLHRVRPTLIVAFNIPCSVVVTFVFMYFSGMTLNVITMVSLIISVGMLVDNGIVVVENIIRHSQMGKTMRQAAVDGAAEVGVAILGSTCTTLVVFVPMYFLDTGNMSIFMEQLGLPLIVALCASLVIALTCVPLIMGNMREQQHESLFLRIEHFFERHRLTRWLGRAMGLVGRINVLDRVLDWYRVSIRFTLRNRLATLTVLAALLFVTWQVPYQRVGMREMPKLDTREVEVQIDVDQNFDAEMTKEVFRKFEEQIDQWRGELAIKSVLTFFQLGGGEINVYLWTEDDDPKWARPPYKTEEVMRILQARLPDDVPGARVFFSMTDEGDQGNSRGVSVTLSGDEPRELEAYAAEFSKVMAGVEGLGEVESDVQLKNQEVRLQIDEALAQRAGVSPAAIAQTVEAALRGARLPFLKQGRREVPVWAQFREEDRQSRANLDNVAVASATGALVPLNELVDYDKAESPSSIQRLDGKNVITLTAAATTEDIGGIMVNLRKAAKDFYLPAGYHIRFGEDLEELGQNFVSFASTLLMAIILIYLVMASLFESYLLPLSIMTTVPIALGGGVWMLYFTGSQLDTVTLIGNILLCGVIVNNGIVIVDHINQLRGEYPNPIDAICQAGMDRFRPVLMTALTTILGLVPLALATTGGASLFAGLGRALIGGMTVGTVLTLWVVPLFYMLIDDFAAWCRAYIGGLRNLVRPRAAGDSSLSA